MFAPIDFGRIEQALTTPKGWADLGLVVVCLGIAWLVDLRVRRARAAAGDATRLHGSFARVMFPLTGLLLVLMATVAFRRYGRAPLFLAIAAPLLVALAAIQLIIYGLRRLFRSQSWLPTSERAIAFTIWALVVFYFLGLLPELAGMLEEVEIPIGRTR